MDRLHVSEAQRDMQYVRVHVIAARSASAYDNFILSLWHCRHANE